MGRTAVRYYYIQLVLQINTETEYFGAQEVVIFFLNTIFNYLKGNCVLRTLARSPLQKIASLFFERDGHTHINTYTQG